MYYVKSKSNGAEIKIEITDENVYTRCIVCGMEIIVDIVEEIKSVTDFDLFCTGTICSQECLDKHDESKKEK